MSFSIKDHVQGQAIFQYYQGGKLWYKASNTDFLFPVPIEDLGTAQALAIDKAMIFMKWIRKWTKEIDNAREAEEQAK